VPEFLWQRDESALRRLALAPLLLAEGPYRLAAALHRRLRGRRSVRLGVPVVSIGNLTVGGSGKTPLAGWLAGELRAGGRKVVLLSRGVSGRRAAEVNVVSDGERLLLGAGDVGDEPVLLAGSVPGVPVLAGRNRVALGYRAAAVFGAEVLLLDDGFQHHRLHRDLDLVCVDAALGLGNGHVLPRGPLREPPRALAKADAVLWTRAPRGFAPERGDARVTSRLRTGVPQFSIAVEPARVRALGSAEPEALDTLRGLEIGVLSAIARPDRLAETLRALGARVSAERRFADHHLYRRRDLEKLAAGRPWVTTAKDAVKIPPSWVEHTRVLVLEEEVRVAEPARLVSWLVESLDALPQRGRA
jgi:tetraacyldisaccharide 4'-kinase